MKHLSIFVLTAALLPFSASAVNASDIAGKLLTGDKKICLRGHYLPDFSGYAAQRMQPCTAQVLFHSPQIRARHHQRTPPLPPAVSCFP